MLCSDLSSIRSVAHASIEIISIQHSSGERAVNSAIRMQPRCTICSHKKKHKAQGLACRKWHNFYARARVQHMLLKSIKLLAKLPIPPREECATSSFSDVGF